MDPGSSSSKRTYREAFTVRPSDRSQQDERQPEPETIDLSDDDDEQRLKNDKLKMLINTQTTKQAEEPKEEKLATIQCIICLDDPTDLSATPCGRFIMENLKFVKHDTKTIIS
jgi:hypothetical protein